MEHKTQLLRPCSR